jgi:deoxyribodipyrimidine photo-lyase
MNACIYWFRNNLRLHDNPSLLEALKRFDKVYPVYVLPGAENRKTQTGLDYYGGHRLKFLKESVEALEAQIASRGGKLSILQGDSSLLLAEWARRLGVREIYASREVGYHEQREEALLSESMDLQLYDDNFLIELDALPQLLEKLPFGFSGFRKKVEKHWYAREVLPLAEGHFHHEVLQRVAMPEVAVDDDERSAHPFTGGEQEGLRRLEHYLWKTGRIEKYKFTRNELIGTEYSSKFSAYLALGCLSPITIYKEVERYEKEAHQNVSTYWLKFELLWREFFRYVALKYGKKLFLPGGLQESARPWHRDKEIIRSWMDGETKDDFVNANMRELKATGFMSNRGRQNAASYLVHDLGQDWRMGAWYFERMLVDYDAASNWGNWQYVSGIGNDRRNHAFDTQWQANKYDGKGRYRKLWARD